jgi:hypothetical protein
VVENVFDSGSLSSSDIIHLIACCGWAKDPAFLVEQVAQIIRLTAGLICMTDGEQTSACHLRHQDPRLLQPIIFFVALNNLAYLRTRLSKSNPIETSSDNAMEFLQLAYFYFLK